VFYFHAKAYYALTGQLSTFREKLSHGGDTIADIQSYQLEGWRVFGVVTQYYFNGTTSTVPFGGFGAGVSRDLPYGKYTLSPFAQVEMASNGETDLLPISLGISLKFPL
jgi:hypothetical protein